MKFTTALVCSAVVSVAAVCALPINTHGELVAADVPVGRSPLVYVRSDDVQDAVSEAHEEVVSEPEAGEFGIGSLPTAEELPKAEEAEAGAFGFGRRIQRAGEFGYGRRVHRAGPVETEASSEPSA
ncbi:hypothetical protein B0O80DRAFT_449344 [Mortierella sp. GBAus27b]|nr:hypothetical protein BGX31_009566 [Mortierella sp. GBA43]KAI8355464.1 hypothetical protein B0O80DRAFT_449344 [Mortierella sp. GBAus27b]